MEKRSLSELWKDDVTCRRVADALGVILIRANRGELEGCSLLEVFDEHFDNFQIAILPTGRILWQSGDCPFWELSDILISAGYYREQKV